MIFALYVIHFNKEFMGHTQLKTLCIISLSVICGLVGCVSNKGTHKLKEQDKQWFCVPHEPEGWLCEKDDTSFKLLAPVKPIETESTVGDIAQEERVDEASLDEAKKYAEPEAGNSKQEESSLSESNDSVTSSEPLSIVSNPSTQPTAKLSLVVPNDTAMTQESIKLKDTPQSPNSGISPWVVQLAAYSTEDSAKQFVQSLGRGQVFKTLVKGKYYFTVALLGFDSRLDAESAAANLKKRPLGLSPWVRSGASFEKNLSH